MTTEIKEVLCTRCGSDIYINVGLQYRHGVKDIQRRRCKSCGKIFVLPDEHPYARVSLEGNNG